MDTASRARALTPTERLQLKLLIRLARFRKTCRKLPLIEVLPAVARVAREKYGIEIDKN